MVKQKQIDGAVASESVGSRSGSQGDGMSVREAFSKAGTPACSDSAISFGADFTHFSGEAYREIWVCEDGYPYVWCDADKGAPAGWYRNKWITPLGEDVSNEPASKWWDKFPVGIQLALPELAASPAQAPALSSSESTATQSDSTKEEV